MADGPTTVTKTGRTLAPRPSARRSLDHPPQSSTASHHQPRRPPPPSVRPRRPTLGSRHGSRQRRDLLSAGLTVSTTVAPTRLKTVWAQEAYGGHLAMDGRYDVDRRPMIRSIECPDEPQFRRLSRMVMVDHSSTVALTVIQDRSRTVPRPTLRPPRRTIGRRSARRCAEASGDRTANRSRSRLPWPFGRSLWRLSRQTDPPIIPSAACPA